MNNVRDMRNVLFCCLIGLLLSFNSIAFAGVEKPLGPKAVAVMAAQASRAFKAENYALAAQLYRELTVLNPKDAVSWQFLGQSLAQTGDVMGAQRAFAKVLEIQPTGQIADSTREMQTNLPPPDLYAMKIDSGLTIGDWMPLAEAQAKQGKRDAVLEKIKQYLDQFGTVPQLLAFQAKLQQEIIATLNVESAETAKAALPQLRELLKQTPDNLDALRLEARACQFMQDYACAEAAYASWLNIAAGDNPERKDMVNGLMQAKQHQPPDNFFSMPKIGVTLLNLTPKQAALSQPGKAGGALVQDVEKGGLADKAGIQAGDVILKFDGKVVNSPIDMPRIAAKISPGSKVVVQLWRAKEHKEIPLTIGEKTPEEIAAMADQAAQAFKAEDYAKAVPLFRELVAFNPQDAQSWSFLGQSLVILTYGKIIDTKAGDAKAGDAKASDAKASDAKASDAKAGDAKAGDAKAGDAKAGDAKAGDAKAGDAKAGDAKAGNTKADDAKAGDAKADDAKADDAKAGDAKADDAKAGDAKADDAKAGDAKANEIKVSAGKFSNEMGARRAFARVLEIQPEGALADSTRALLAKLPEPDLFAMQLDSGITLGDWMNLAQKQSAEGKRDEVLQDISVYLEQFGPVPQLLALQAKLQHEKQAEQEQRLQSAVAVIKVYDAETAKLALPQIRRLKAQAPNNLAVLQLEGRACHLALDFPCAETAYGAWLKSAPGNDPLRDGVVQALMLARQYEALPLPPPLPPAPTATGEIIRDCDYCPEMVAISTGNFEMGEANAKHTVTFARPFAISKTEVTQGQWKEMMGSRPSHFHDCGDNCPVEKISWNDAQEFIRRLNQRTGKTYRLPSEAEWEVACRAGKNQEYCGSDDADAVAWYGAYAAPSGNSGKTTHPVATRQANAWGIYDMSGNVWEWVADSWHDSFDGAPANGEAWSGDAQKRVVRGGSWVSKPQHVRASYRDWDGVADRNYLTGFRLARTLP